MGGSGANHIHVKFPKFPHLWLGQGVVCQSTGQWLSTGEWAADGAVLVVGGGVLQGYGGCAKSLTQLGTHPKTPGMQHFRASPVPGSVER